VIQAGGEIVHSEIHEIINSLWNLKNWHNINSALLLQLYMRKSLNVTVIITEDYCFQILAEFFTQFKTLYEYEVCKTLWEK
jgi:hypothetical protein